MNLNDLRNRVHSLAVSKGWYEDVDDVEDPTWLGARLALIHSEVSEALEDVRNRALQIEYANSAGARHAYDLGQHSYTKPVGLPSELADIIIRTLDLCGALGIDIQAAVELKHAYNATRLHRHGGKAL